MTRPTFLYGIIYLLFSFIHAASGQTLEKSYNNAFAELCDMYEGRKPMNFKRAVYVTESAYLDQLISYEQFCRMIDFYVDFSKKIIQSRELQYSEKDKHKAEVYAGVFSAMCDTIPIQIKDSVIENFIPFGYQFDDFAGNKNWKVMTVTNLLMTHKGNCHSLPFLYKIIVEELGEKAWLSFAPNHIYIKLHNKQCGWYNTELTCGIFPVDAWLMASGYIHLDAVRNSIYMDTLSQRQSIALCILDLAQGYA